MGHAGTAPSRRAAHVAGATRDAGVREGAAHGSPALRSLGAGCCAVVASRGVAETAVVPRAVHAGTTVATIVRLPIEGFADEGTHGTSTVVHCRSAAVGGTLRRVCADARAAAGARQANARQRAAGNRGTARVREVTIGVVVAGGDTRFVPLGVQRGTDDSCSAAERPACLGRGAAGVVDARIPRRAAEAVAQGCRTPSRGSAAGGAGRSTGRGATLGATAASGCKGYQPR
jgi:hypothetical protein